MTQTRAYAAFDARAVLAPYTFERREPGARDVVIEIMYCGVCHSDVHTVRSEWKGTTYPCVPGHEIIGRVIRVGDDVTGFRAGALAAVGCLVDSCRRCANCTDGYEQFCDAGATWTYNSADQKMRGKPTYGGYSSTIVVDEHFCLRVPDGLDPASGAPLLCAGITTYSPLRHWGAGPGKKVGIVGLGGLGHMGIKLSHALGAHTVLFTTSADKIDDGMRLGADEVVLSTDAQAMRKHDTSFHMILDTVSVSHDLDAYASLLGRDGALVLVGGPEHPHVPSTMSKLISRRRSIAGSLIGGIAETQEMLDFCAARGITCDVEMIDIQQINEAHDRVVAKDIKYRFVIDLESLRDDQSRAI
ncbi:MAG TPA: NAD(P)-dependent alcohol dehydrogenase [Gemmatimonadaceae bacterium]|nr:NAD(P)-dependent alcohol dehydrogenase [Gemmatimonadaceae bacterium]